MDGVLSPPHLAGDVEQAGLEQPVLPTKSSVTVPSRCGLHLLFCESSLQIFRGERSQNIAGRVELFGELAVGRIEFKEHQCALGASLFHVFIIRRLFGVIPDTPDP